MDIFHQFPVYKKVPLADAFHYTGKGPIGTKWVDVNKGDEKDPEYRSRLVAMEIKRKHDEDIFAATPPLEAKKLLFSMATTGTKGSSKPLKLLFVDVKRAYFYAKCKRPVFVKLPDEDSADGQCGRLEVSMYGTRDAASNWEEEYTNSLVKFGFNPGVSTPCAFYNAERDIKCVVHGDDFTFLGTDDDLSWIQKKMSERYEVKIRGRLGPQAKDDKVIRILNRIVEWGPNGIEYEVGQRHAEIIVRDGSLKKEPRLQLQESKSRLMKMMKLNSTARRPPSSGDWQPEPTTCHQTVRTFSSQSKNSRDPWQNQWRVHGRHWKDSQGTSRKDQD